jgi:hypothetical protein
VKTAQAFRPHVLDMFEPQDHPNDIPYPGGAPNPPYDSAGYTLAFQMGVKFDRVLDGFEGPFETLSAPALPPPGRVTQDNASGGYLLSHDTNDAFVAVNRLLKAGRDVYWLTSPVTAGGRTFMAGTMYIAPHGTLGPILQQLAASVGLSFQAMSSRPTGEAFRLRPVRVGLVDRYGGSMPSGWARWLFEQFEFPFEVVYPQGLDTGDLRSRFDVLVFMDGAIPAREEGTSGPPPESVPPEFRPWLGNVTIAHTVPQIRRFLEDGGIVATVGSSTVLASHLGLPVGNGLLEKVAGGPDRPLGREKYYVPGSVLQVAVDDAHPLGWGIGKRVDVMFDESPVFRLHPDAGQRGTRAIAWFDSPAPLRSGWAWGQHHLEGSAVVVEAAVGKGKVFLFGPEITFRAQPHGTFKFLFNAIYYGTATRGRIGAPAGTALEPSAGGALSGR